MIIGFPSFGMTGSCLTASRDGARPCRNRPESHKSGHAIGRARRNIRITDGLGFCYMERVFRHCDLYFKEDRVSLYYVAECGMNISMLSSVWRCAPGSPSDGAHIEFNIDPVLGF